MTVHPVDQLACLLLGAAFLFVVVPGLVARALYQPPAPRRDEANPVRERPHLELIP